MTNLDSNMILPGKYHDKETGLHDNYARYYHPSIGRFISVDPLGFDSGDINLYVYAKNNPVILIDPFGLSAGSNRFFYKSGNWKRNADISGQLGQVVWITVKNINVLETTISIQDNAFYNTQQRIILPLSKVDFKFAQFGTEPMQREFRIRTNSDAFIVNYIIESTWVPGMVPNR